MKFKCCEEERLHLICSGRSTDGRRNSVQICESCGRFEVRFSENGAHFSTTFHLWSEVAIDAAIKPFNRAAAEVNSSARYLPLAEIRRLLDLREHNEMQGRNAGRRECARQKHDR